MPPISHRNSRKTARYSILPYQMTVMRTFENFYPENESKDAPPIKHRDSQKMYDLSRAHN